MSIQILLADDHTAFRDGMQIAIPRIDNHLAIVGEAATGEETVRMAQELHPDIVVLDYQLPDMDGAIDTG